MIILDTTTRKLSFDVSGAANEFDIAVSYVDVTTTTCTPGVQRTTVNVTTEVDICAAPASSTQRLVKEILITAVDGSTSGNVATSTANFEVIFYDNATKINLLSSTIFNMNGARAIRYTEDDGWSLVEPNGGTEIMCVNNLPRAFAPRGSCDRANATATIALTSATSVAVRVGPYIEGIKAVQVSFRVTTNPATLTYVELALARGAVSLGGNMTLYQCGWMAWDQMIGTGVKSFVIPMLPNTVQTNSSNADLWVIIGTQATTAGTLRGGLADDLQSGIYGTSATRPSAVARSGAGTTFTLAGATTVVPLVQAVYFF